MCIEKPTLVGEIQSVTDNSAIVRSSCTEAAFRGLRANQLVVVCSINSSERIVASINLMESTMVEIRGVGTEDAAYISRNTITLKFLGVWHTAVGVTQNVFERNRNINTVVVGSDVFLLENEGVEKFMSAVVREEGEKLPYARYTIAVLEDVKTLHSSADLDVEEDNMKKRQDEQRN